MHVLYVVGHTLDAIFDLECQHKEEEIALGGLYYAFLTILHFFLCSHTSSHHVHILLQSNVLIRTTVV